MGLFQTTKINRWVSILFRLVSEMLNYKKGLSKETIRILSDRFKLNQEAFNRPYELKKKKVYSVISLR